MRLNYWVVYCGGQIMTAVSAGARWKPISSSRKKFVPLHPEV